jgi:hypothetical protein
MERELVARVEGRGVDDDPGIILIYRLGEQVSLVATSENGGDAEVILDRAAVAAFSEALKKISV